ncbi:29209_t:CDS:2, partial [Racocetra persica]
MSVVSVCIKAESVKVNWIGVPVPENITVKQFYEDLVAGKIVPEAIEAWGNRVQYYQTDSSTSLSSEIS